jgi:hypothetical protein
VKIGVLTFHRCINYGSYWQARSLVEGLRARGHDAVVLDHRCAWARSREWRCAFQPLLPERSTRREMRQYAGKARKVLAAVAGLPSSPPFPLEAAEAMEPYDCVVVGSDEVWNLRHPWYGGRRAFYGEGLPARRIVSYAASFGNHEAAEGLPRDWSDKLRRFDTISVRDRNARRMLQDALGEDPELVLDPVLQFPIAPTQPSANDAPYLAVYGHGFPRSFAQAVRAHADRAGLRLVSIGYRNAWAHEQRLDAGPKEFARLIAGASAVATNFFHGCVFALLNERPFACIASDYRATKLRDLMHEVGGERHLVAEDDAADRVGELLAAPLDPAIGATIARLRRRSNAYLERALA